MSNLLVSQVWGSIFFWSVKKFACFSSVYLTNTDVFTLVKKMIEWSDFVQLKILVSNVKTPSNHHENERSDLFLFLIGLIRPLWGKDEVDSANRNVNIPEPF